MNDCGKLARLLTPKARILIAPYGIRGVADDQEYRDQLRRMDVDIIAYQDGVGCHHASAFDTPWMYSRLARIHQDVPNIELWADMETFSLERGSLTPALFPRIQAQMEGISPFVKTILIFRYQDVMANWPAQATGQRAENPLLHRYRAWLKKNHPLSPETGSVR